VCILTPGQIGSNPRVVKEAQALHEAGCQVTVIATRILDLVEPRDQSLMQRIPWRLERIDLRSRWRRRLNRAVAIARRQLHTATGLAHFADLGFSASTRPLTAAASRISADLYIAHYPTALPAAVEAARCHGGRYAYDAEDFHLGDWPDNPDYDAERRLVRAIEERHLRGCAHVTAASPDIADAYVEAYGVARPTVVRNTSPLAQAPPGPTGKGTVEPGPSLYWFSQTIGADRGLECAVRAVALAAARPHLYLRGTPAAGFVDRLREIATECGAAARLHILPPDEPDRMERLAASYDIGLCAEPAYTMSNAVALSNKLFAYLLAGIPPIMSDTLAQRRFAAEANMTERLFPVDDAQALAAIIDRLLDPARLGAARAEAYRLGREQYNWENESGALLQAVRRALEPGSDQAERSFARAQ
jgi:glycosyltransferase involved in cell wall biosynthesis